MNAWLRLYVIVVYRPMRRLVRWLDKRIAS